jgi:hypothetical protein
LQNLKPFGSDRRLAQQAVQPDRARKRARRVNGGVMPERDMRYKAATVVTATAVCLTAGIAYWLSAGELRSIGLSSPQDDSGAVQGFAIFVVASLVAFVATVVVFPTSGWWLEKRSRFTWARWMRRMLAGVASLSLVASVVIVLLLGDSLANVAEIVTLAVMLFCISTVLLVPFSCLWRVLVTSITSRSNRSRVERAPV